MSGRSLWVRVLTGDGMRKTRFHTYSGRRVDARGLADLPRSVWSGFLLKAFGYRLETPWLGYRAARRLSHLLRPDSRVLEFGSGMSSLFLARHCREVVTIESDPAWFEHVTSLLKAHRLTNVDCRLRAVDDYVNVDEWPDHSFDLVVNDGILRDRVSAAALRKVRPRGYVFLDNSDVPNPEYQRARDSLLAAASPDDVWFFNDFYPFQVQVNESLLVQVDAHAST
jgi:hypothetical protein